MIENTTTAQQQRRTDLLMIDTYFSINGRLWQWTQRVPSDSATWAPVGAGQAQADDGEPLGALGGEAESAPEGQSRGWHHIVLGPITRNA